jgi:hypothetical protein
MSRGVLLVAIIAATLASPGVVRAQDSPAAVLAFPYIVSAPDAGMDTLVQLTNVSSDAVDALCFYEDFTLDCMAGSPGESCGPGPMTCSGFCQPGDGERVPFPVRLTPEQPIAWHVSQGLTNAPLDGVDHSGPNGANNQGTAVPNLGSRALVGTLRCTVVGADQYRPGVDNVLVGLATIESRASFTDVDAMQYRALGFRAVEDGPGPNRDEFLELGGPEGEYESCPAAILLEHFFDNGPLRTSEQTAHVQSGIALATCTAPFGQPGRSVAQFLVYNELDQRFSTSISIAGQRVTRLANIDTNDANRSIFSAAVAGTLAGQTIIRGVGSGLMAIGTERHVYSADKSRSVAYNVHGLSVRADSDYVAYRPARCIGDCNLDGTVRVNELVAGVNIALSQLDRDRCQAMDDNGDLAVKVNELVSATNAALSGCPLSTVPTPLAAAAESIAAQGAAAGPEITVLGLTTADDRPLDSTATDDAGRPIFVRPFGQGMTILVEARAGASGRAVGRRTYNEDGLMPYLQVIVSNPLGDGAAEVCENDGTRGGIPGNSELDFDAPDAPAAINDLGCRAFGREGLQGQGAFTKVPRATDVWHFVDTRSQLQFGIPIAKAWAFPVGRTIIAVRVRDVVGELSAVKEIAVDVSAP